MRIGTRGSILAKIQAERVKARLEATYPGLDCELVVVSTIGDRDKQTPLTVIGGQGIFAKELQAAMLDGRIDCAVHSLKDLPSLLPAELTLAAVLDRDDPRDVFLSPTGATLDELPEGSRVGTSSRRRMAQLLHARPDVEIIELRGNVDTRVSKVMDGGPERYDGAILAAAGMRRMGYEEHIAQLLDLDRFTPAPGPGGARHRVPRRRRPDGRPACRNIRSRNRDHYRSGTSLPARVRRRLHDAYRRARNVEG